LFDFLILWKEFGLLCSTGSLPKSNALENMEKWLSIMLFSFFTILVNFVHLNTFGSSPKSNTMVNVQKLTKYQHYPILLLFWQTLCTPILSDLYQN